MNNQNKSVKLFGILLLIGIMVGCSLISTTTAFNYSSSIQKETIDLKVSYDSDLWNSTKIISPEYYFGEDANKSGATGKFTVRSWYQDTLNTSEIFFNLLGPFFLHFNTSSEIDNYYQKRYSVREVLTTSPFKDNSSLPHITYIMKDPSDLKTLYDNYSSYAADIGSQVPSYSKEQFLFEIFIKFTGGAMGVASPVNGYLSEIVDVFGDENITKGNNRLILNLYDKDNYTVHINFASTGLKTSLIFLNEDGTAFYRISSSQESWVVWVFIGVPSAAAIAVVVYALYRRYKRKKTYEESLKKMKA